jgi:hypothetical protein
MGGRRVTLWQNNRSGAADGGEVSDAGGLGDVLGNLIHQFRNAYPALPRWQYLQAIDSDSVIDSSIHHS